MIDVQLVIFVNGFVDMLFFFTPKYLMFIFKQLLCCFVVVVKI